MAHLLFVPKLPLSLHPTRTDAIPPTPTHPHPPTHPPTPTHTHARTHALPWVQTLYRLQAIVNHEGGSASSGHFTTDTCDEGRGGVWYRHDDSLVTRISSADATSAARQRQCYLLFYTAAA